MARRWFGLSKSHAVIGILALAGFFQSFTTTWRHRRYRQELRRLEAEVGRMEIRDPDKIYVVPVASPSIPAAVKDEVIACRQFRVYYPAGFQSILMPQSGPFDPDSLLATESSGYFGSGPWNKPGTDLISIVIGRSDAGIQIWIGTKSSAGRPDIVRGCDEDHATVRWLESPSERALEFDRDAIIELGCVFDDRPATEMIVNGEPHQLHRGMRVLMLDEKSSERLDRLRRGLKETSERGPVRGETN